MDCSLREASRKDQSIAAENEFFWTHRDHKKGQISLPKCSFGVSETARFCASQRLLVSVLFEVLYFRHFLSFYNLQLEPPKNIIGPNELNLGTTACGEPLVSTRASG